MTQLVDVRILLNQFFLTFVNKCTGPYSLLKLKLISCLGVARFVLQFLFKYRPLVVYDSEESMTLPLKK